MHPAAVTGRDLLTPDEILQMSPNVQLLRIRAPSLVQKLRYYADPNWRDCSSPLSFKISSDQKICTSVVLQ